MYTLDKESYKYMSLYTNIRINFPKKPTKTKQEHKINKQRNSQRT